MNKKLLGHLCIALVLCFVVTSVSFAAEAGKETAVAKAQKAGQAVVNYPANVVKESVDVISNTGKKGTAIVVKTTKKAGQVLTGEVDKTKELVTEPLEDTAEMGKTAVEETVQAPIKAAKTTKEELKKKEVLKK